jgi:hypothetical protein
MEREHPLIEDPAPPVLDQLTRATESKKPGSARLFV